MNQPLENSPPPTAPDGQSDVIAFLSDPESYSTPPDKVEHVETHGAHVFLVGDRALKIKRDVKFPYLDYSSLERRAKMCRREFELNRLTAPLIYRRVRAITHEEDGSLTFDGKGKCVEWVLEMNRFDETRLLINLARRNAITPTIAKDLAERIESYHAGLAPVSFVDSGEMFHCLVEQLTDAFKAGSALLGVIDGAPREAEENLTNPRLPSFPRRRSFPRRPS